MEVLLRLES